MESIAKKELKHLFDATNNNFAGRRIQQTWADLCVLNRVLNEHKPNIIVELGTDKGGSAKFFSNYAPVYTIDWRREEDLKDMYDVHTFLGDIYDQDTKIFVRNLLETKGRTFLFVDGGTKPKTFSQYAPFLKGGDVVFLHDFPNQYPYDVIEPTVRENNLTLVWKDRENSMLIGFKK